MEKQIENNTAIAVITKDTIGNGERNGKKLKLSNTENLTKKHFKLYDDDGILYYRGYFFDDEWCENQDELLRWAMYDSGCTIIKVSEDGKTFIEEIA